MRLKTRRVYIAGISQGLDNAWMAQIARNLTDAKDGFLKDVRHLIVDRDPLYTEQFKTILASSAVELLKLPPSSPNLKDYASYCTPLARCDATLMEARLCHSYLAGASSHGAS